MGVMAPQITSLTIVYTIVYSGADQRKHQSSASLSFVRGIHRGPVNSPHKWPVTRKMFSFDDVIMDYLYFVGRQATTWTNVDLVPIRSMETNVNEVRIKIKPFKIINKTNCLQSACHTFSASVI